MAVDRFALLADPTRRRILGALSSAGSGGRTAGELARSLELGRPLVSYHLARLAAAGVVAAEPDPADRRRRRYVVRRGASSVPGGALVTPRASRRAGPPGRPVPAGPGVHGSLEASLPPEARDRLARLRRRRSVEAGELLFGQGDPASGLWFVESGAVRVFTSDANGREQTLQVLGAGSTFNEVPFFDGGPEPASAQAIEAGIVGHVPQSARDRLVREVPQVAGAMAAGFAARLRHTLALVEDLGFRHVTGRVARVLLQAVEPHRGVGAGAAGRALTQREIGEMAGTPREVAARALRELEGEGLIRIERGRIVILDRGGLARHA